MNPSGSQSIANAPGRRHVRASGFTLVEMMVVVAIIGILLVVAMPSFRWLISVNRLTTPANEMVATLQVARMESIRRNARTVVCRSDNPDATAAAACSNSTASWTGWIAFVDNGDNGTGTIVALNARNGQRDAGETLLRAASAPTPVQVRVSSNLTTESNRVSFRSDGLARAAVSGNPLSSIVSICLPDASIGENVREVSLAAGSRIAVSRRTDAACGTPPNTR